jgi:hypothetical protein
MRQSRAVFYREEQKEEKEGGRVGKMEGTTYALGDQYVLQVSVKEVSFEGSYWM